MGNQNLKPIKHGNAESLPKEIDHAKMAEREEESVGEGDYSSCRGLRGRRKGVSPWVSRRRMAAEFARGRNRKGRRSAAVRGTSNARENEKERGRERVERLWSAYQRGGDSKEERDDAGGRRNRERVTVGCLREEGRGGWRRGEEEGKERQRQCRGQN